MIALAAALLLWAAPARAAALPGEACVAVPGWGCWFAPDSIRDENAPTLIVFHRGWRNERERSRVPVRERAASARQAFVQFDLEKLARARRAAVLVTGASGVPVEREQLLAVERALNLRFARAVLASHSGGYAGLDETLRLGTFPRVQRLVMLDNFYEEDALLVRVSALVAAGTSCVGFWTTHEKPSIQQHQEAFGRVCRLENHDDTGHYDTVKRCLGSYVEGLACP